MLTVAICAMYRLGNAISAFITPKKYPGRVVSERDDQGEERSNADEDDGGDNRPNYKAI